MSTANNFSILASAGTGKTYQLSVRIARLLMLDKIEPSQIIALTFTRAAAAEFYLRTLERLKEAATDDAKRLLICGVHPADDPSPVDKDNPLVLDPAKYPKEAFAKKLRELVLKSDRLALGTLDSFFVRLVNQFPLELGLETSHPSIVTDQQGPLLLGNAVVRFFEEMGDGDSLSQLGQHLSDYSDGKAAANPAETLLKMAKANHELLTLAPSAELWGKPASIWPKGMPAELVLNGETPDAGNDLNIVLTALERYPEGKEGGEKWRGALKEKMELVGGAVRISDITPDDLQNFLERYGPALEKKHADGFTISYQRDTYTVTFKTAEVTAIRRLLWRLFSMAVRTAIKKTGALHACLTGFERAYDLENRRKGHLSFSDYVILLSAWLAPLARKEEVQQIVEEIQFRLDSQIKHWLLDEFQDTGTRQYDVLRRNIDEIIQQSGGDRSVFVVGDAKQSLYEWRSGNRELLTRLNDLIGKNGNRADLNQTRRCSPQVLKLVNELLSNLTERKLGDYFSPIAARDWDSVFQPQASHPKAPQVGQSLWVRITDEQAKDEPVETQARWIAEDLDRSGVLEDATTGNRRLKSGITCAILVGKNDDAADIAEMLRVKGIEATDEASTAVIRDNPVTAGLFAIIESTAHPDNGLARGLAWMSPTSRRLLQDDKGRPNWPVTSRKVADLFAACGAEAVVDWLAGTITKKESSDFINKRLRQFRAIAADYDTTGGRDLSEFITFADSSHLRDTADKRSVQVITIHRSKGLEYDVVYMPCLNDSHHKMAEVRGNLLYMTPAMRQKSDAKSNSIYDESLFRPDWILSGMNGAIAKHIPGLKEATEALAGEGGYGSLCRLYVGMTRARVRLVMLSNKLSDDATKVNADKHVSKGHFEHPSNHGNHDFAKFLESALGKSCGEGTERPKSDGTVEAEIAWSDSPTPSDTSWVAACGKKSGAGEDKGAGVVLVPDGSKFVAAIRPPRNKPSAQPNTFEAPWAKATSELRGKQFGTYVHELFARLERDADGFLTKLSTLKAAEGMETVHATAVERIKACLADKSIRQLLVGDLEGKLLWVERKAVVMNEKGLTPAVFDRVHIVPGKSALIIDYKTATGRTDTYLKEHYTKQMESYRDAVSRLTGITPENIHAKLIGIQEKGVSIVDVI